MKIFHVADIHLGRRRLDGRLPDGDFKRAFAHIADQAIRDRADVFLIAGDLFDRPAVEPPHLRQAQEVLAELKDKGIRGPGRELRDAQQDRRRGKRAGLGLSRPPSQALHPGRVPRAFVRPPANPTRPESHLL